MAQLGVSGARPLARYNPSEMSGPDYASSTEDAIHRLKEEIDKLTKEQSQALDRAVYLGMSPEEAREYTGRRKLILKYVQDLAILEQSL